MSDVTPRSVFGQQLNFKVTAGGATIDGAGIKETDLPCANGIVHVIDSVIPPWKGTWLDILRKDGRFGILVNLLDACGLSLNVASSQEFTVFAPTDDAWKASGQYADLIANPSGRKREEIFGLIARHVIVGKHVTENSKPYNRLRTIHGAPIYLLREAPERAIGGVSAALRLPKPDRRAGNGGCCSFPRRFPTSGLSATWYRPRCAPGAA